MKKSNRIIFGILIVASVSVLLLTRKGQNRSAQTYSALSTNRTETEHDSISNPDGEKHGTQSVKSAPDTNVSVADQSHQAELQKLKTFLEAGNIPRSYWGKVVDQDSVPLVDVKIHLDENQNAIDMKNERVGTHSIPHHLVSDGDGNFELLNANANSITVESMEKEGYELSPKRSRMNTNEPAHANNRIIFKMWKKRGVEAIITADKFYGIKPDGRFYTLDLLHEKKIEGKDSSGDLLVTIIRPEKVTPRQQYDWSFTIDGIEGGILESSDEFMYLAPESGYQSHFKFSMSEANREWSGHFNGKFYIKSRKGQIYGRMEIEVIADYSDKSIFSVKYFVNPDASRNLEYIPH